MIFHIDHEEKKVTSQNIKQILKKCELNSFLCAFHITFSFLKLIEILCRSNNHSGSQMGINPSDPMWFQHFVFSQQQGSQAPLVSQSNIVRPGASTFAFLPSQGPKCKFIMSEVYIIFF